MKTGNLYEITLELKASSGLESERGWARESTSCFIESDAEKAIDLAMQKYKDWTIKSHRGVSIYQPNKLVEAVLLKKGVYYE